MSLLGDTLTLRSLLEYPGGFVQQAQERYQTSESLVYQQELQFGKQMTYGRKKWKEIWMMTIWEHSPSEAIRKRTREENQE